MEDQVHNIELDNNKVSQKKSSEKSIVWHDYLISDHVLKIVYTIPDIHKIHSFKG